MGRKSGTYKEVEALFQRCAYNGCGAFVVEEGYNVPTVDLRAVDYSVEIHLCHYHFTEAVKAVSTFFRQDLPEPFLPDNTASDSDAPSSDAPSSVDRPLSQTATVNGRMLPIGPPRTFISASGFYVEEPTSYIKDGVLYRGKLEAE